MTGGRWDVRLFSSINSNFDSDYVRQWKDRLFFTSTFIGKFMIEITINRT
jgi:hypothetical protein